MATEALKDELTYFYEQFDNYNGHPIHSLANTTPVETVIASDASKIGFGTIKIRCGGATVHEEHGGSCQIEVVGKGEFDKDQILSSSANREFVALKNYYVDQGAPGLEGRSGLHLCKSI